MKRSEVNQAIRFSMETLDKIQFRLPDFAYWGINEWKERKDRKSTRLNSSH